MLLWLMVDGIVVDDHVDKQLTAVNKAWYLYIFELHRLSHC